MARTRSLIMEEEMEHTFCPCCGPSEAHEVHGTILCLSCGMPLEAQAQGLDRDFPTWEEAPSEDPQELPIAA